MKASSQMSIFVTFGKTINRWHLVVAQVSPSCYLPHEKTIATFFFASFHTSLDHHRNYFSLARWPPSPLVNLYRHMNPIMLKVLNSIKKLPPSPSKVSSANTQDILFYTWKTGAQENDAVYPRVNIMTSAQINSSFLWSCKQERLCIPVLRKSLLFQNFLPNT